MQLKQMKWYEQPDRARLSRIFLKVDSISLNYFQVVDFYSVDSEDL